jgi:hypothetical protein
MVRTRDDAMLGKSGNAPAKATGPNRNEARQAGGTRDNRAEPRYPVHLRSGRIADAQRKLICHCVVRDRSARGARLILPSNVCVPDRIWFYDDEFKACVKAEVRWRGSQELGILIPEFPLDGKYQNYGDLVRLQGAINANQQKRELRSVQVIYRNARSPG